MSTNVEVVNSTTWIIVIWRIFNEDSCFIQLLENEGLVV